MVSPKNKKSLAARLGIFLYALTIILSSMIVSNGSRKRKEPGAKRTRRTEGAIG